MMTNFSVRMMASAYQAFGSVMVTRTVKMDQMNTTLAHRSLADPTITSVKTSCAFQQAGSVTVTMTAWTWVMNRIAPLLLFAVHLASGSAPPINCALTWIRFVMANLTVPTEPTSPPFAVSTVNYSLSCILQKLYDNFCNVNDKWSNAYITDSCCLIF